MKFLLTSSEITNNSIARAAIDLVDKAARDTSVVFIPTVANTVAGDKGWLIDNLNEFKKRGYKST